MTEPLTIVGLGGSLAHTSRSLAALQVALDGAAEAGASTKLLNLRELDLPMYNPDDEREPPPAASTLIEACYGADAMLWSSPMYQGTISGAFKNALDWLVGSHEFPGKPVALINTSPRATHALNSLTITLETMSAHLVKDASIALPLLGTSNDADSIAANPEFAGPLRAALERFAGAIGARAGDDGDGAR